MATKTATTDGTAPEIAELEKEPQTRRTTGPELREKLIELACRKSGETRWDSRDIVSYLIGYFEEDKELSEALKQHLEATRLILR